MAKKIQLVGSKMVMMELQSIFKLMKEKIDQLEAAANDKGDARTESSGGKQEGEQFDRDEGWEALVDLLHQDLLSADYCPNCNRKFHNLFRRRKTCRLCTHVVCDDCSKKRVLGKRVCDSCFSILKQDSLHTVQSPPLSSLRSEQTGKKFSISVPSSDGRRLNGSAVSRRDVLSEGPLSPLSSKSGVDFADDGVLSDSARERRSVSYRYARFLYRIGVKVVVSKCLWV